MDGDNGVVQRLRWWRGCTRWRCRIGYVDHTDCHQLVLMTIHPTRACAADPQLEKRLVSTLEPEKWFPGFKVCLSHSTCAAAFWGGSAGVLYAMVRGCHCTPGGCQIGHMDHTARHQSVFLTKLPARVAAPLPGGFRLVTWTILAVISWTCFDVTPC